MEATEGAVQQTVARYEEVGVISAKVDIDWNDPYMDERAAIACLRSALRAAGVPDIPSVVLSDTPAMFGGSEAFLELEKVLVKHGGMWAMNEEEEFVVVINHV